MWTWLFSPSKTRALQGKRIAELHSRGDGNVIRLWNSVVDAPIHLHTIEDQSRANTSCGVGVDVYLIMGRHTPPAPCYLHTHVIILKLLESLSPRPQY